MVDELDARGPQAPPAAPEQIAVSFLVQAVKVALEAALVRRAYGQLLEGVHVGVLDALAQGLDAGVQGLVLGDAPVDDAEVGGGEVQAADEGEAGEDGGEEDGQGLEVVQQLALDGDEGIVDDALHPRAKVLRRDLDAQHADVR